MVHTLSKCGRAPRTQLAQVPDFSLVMGVKTRAPKVIGIKTKARAIVHKEGYKSRSRPKRILSPYYNIII